ncbi:MAG: type II toxin-antitoxin system Phd/YefM family antitoxin, partial [Spirochaetia bacterium]
MDDITVKEIGSFEAKTHLSSLLREVEEKGTEFHITRRGKAVAVLKRDEKPGYADPVAALERIRKITLADTIEELLELRDEGRER